MHTNVVHSHIGDSSDTAASLRSVSRSHPHAHFDLEAGIPPTNTDIHDHAVGAEGNGQLSPGHRPHSMQSAPDHDVSKIPIAPVNFMKRRATRSATVKTFQSTKTAAAARPQWGPGQEPGLDPSKPNGGRNQSPMLHEVCQITVVDFSEDDMEMHDFDNEGLINFIQKPQESWIKCRWINVNGLSWDVIQALGKYKKLHRLAIEDLVNTDNRTKVDWYTDHTFMILALHKLVHLHPDADDSECDSETDASVRPEPGHGEAILSSIKGLFSSKPKRKTMNGHMVAGVHDSRNSQITGHTDGEKGAPIKKMRTLQRFHGGPNEDRMAYMEKHSALTRKQLAVSAEQVSIFLTADNTVVSFFENSADDLEIPILHRLSTPDTVLRRSCDASMLVQALLDAMIDLAIPVTDAYQDILGELELSVLTEPSIKHTGSLYIVTSEVTKLRTYISPVINLINALRDHKMTVNASESGRNHNRSAHSSVEISGMARTYLGDVEDHIILMTDSLDTMRRSCDNMIDLIFNTISAYQNESMKQLTVVTIIFLPLSFLTGYFGMNIQNFPAIHHDESYFWEIAIPVAFVVTIFLMKDMLKWYFVRLVQRRGISRNRKSRLEAEKRQ